MQDFLRMYANLAEKCFNTCCNDFTSKALSSKEVTLHTSHLILLGFLNGLANQETCVLNCTEKFIKHSERVGARFAEYNAGK
jgi:import inner membrane translocase subunit TIM9